MDKLSRYFEEKYTTDELARNARILETMTEDAASIARSLCNTESGTVSLTVPSRDGNGEFRIYLGLKRDGSGEITADHVEVQACPRHPETDPETDRPVHVVSARRWSGGEVVCPVYRHHGNLPYPGATDTYFDT